MKWVVIGVVAVVAAGGAVAALWSSSPTEEEKLILACEEILADRLRAPSTYQRISITQLSSSTATYEQYMGWDAPDQKRQDDEALARDPAFKEIRRSQKELFEAGPHTRFSAWIEYDAANAYGTPVRGAAECVLIKFADHPFEISGLSDIRVDGYDALGWSVYQLWLARQ